MARIRTLKPEILEDDRTASLSDTAFRLFVAAIVLADDHGNLRADERWLAGQIWWSEFAAKRGETRRIAAALQELSKACLVTLYVVRAQKYMAIRSWSKHQRIDNAGKPRVPRPCDEGAEVSRNFAANLGETPPDLRPPTSDHDPEGDPDLEGEHEGGVPPRPPGKRATPLPPDWRPSRSAPTVAAEQLAATHGVNLALELERMADWAAAKGQTGKDWDARWRNWLRTATERAPGGQRRKETATDVALRLIREDR